MKTVFRLSTLLLVAIHLFGGLLPWDSGLPLFGAALLVLLSGFSSMGRGFRVATGAFLALSLGLAILGPGARGAGLADWMAAFTSMTNIVAIVAVMQVFSVPIRAGDYDREVREWMGRRLGSEGALFVFTTFVTHLLTSFLNLGSVPVLVSLFGEALRRRVSDFRRFMAATALRGYVLAALWSPGAVNLYLVVHSTGLSWSAVFVPGLLLALLGMGLSPLFELCTGGLGRRGGRIENEAPLPASDPRGGLHASTNRFWHILVAALAFVAAVYLLERLDIGSPSTRMIQAGALLATLWILLLSGRKRRLVEELSSYWRQGLFKAGEVGPFFVALGLFVGALELSGLMGATEPFLREGARALGWGSVPLLGLLIILGSLVGLHPFVTIVLFGKVLMGADLPLPPLTLALGLSVGGAAAYMVSPFSGVATTLSRLIGARTVDLALTWNWRFALLFFATGMAFAFAWGAAFG